MISTCCNLVLILGLGLGLLNLSESQISTGDFFPYGITNGDRALAKEDDNYLRIRLNFSFPFFDSSYRNLYLSTNGIITFGSGSRSYSPQRFPLPGFPSVAVYWTDSDPSRGGDIFYRLTNESTILNRINTEIRSKFIQYSTFTSKWAFLFTYDRVSAYGCGSSSTGPGTCSKRCTDIVLYQGILATDGEKSFAIFLYNTLDYTSGAVNCNGQAQIGYNAGDNERYSLVPKSNTRSIADTALNRSNVGVPGKWMFQIDGSGTDEGCNLHGKLEIYPRKTLYFGHENLTITGPCVNDTREKLWAKFDRATVLCSVINQNQIQCIAPYFNRTGSISVVLTYQGTLYYTFLMIVDIDDLIVVDSQIEFIDAENLDASFDITYNSAVFNRRSQISVKGYQIDISTHSTTTSVIDLDYGIRPNTGRFSLRPTFNSNTLSLSIRIIKVVLTDYSSRLPIVPRIIVLFPNSNCESHCRTWHNSQPSESEMEAIINRTSSRSPCAPAVSTNFPRLTGNFALNEICNPNNPQLCAIFEPGAVACYKSTNNWGQYVSQCCYDTKGSLILGPLGGGTVDFVSSSVDKSGHFIRDLIPYHTCCRCSKQCNRYYEKRPSIDSSNFGKRDWANAGGDPHFKTIDGTEYTFNAVGEFIYLLAGDETIQVRMSQFVDQNDIPRLASYFSAFAIKGEKSDIIQIELNKLNNFQFRINGQRVRLDLGLWKCSGISMDYLARDVVEITTFSGLTAEFHINGAVLHIILAIPEKLKGQVSGLIGNWDENPINDLKLPNGSFIPTNSSPEYIHNYFGMSWVTTNETSLFTYPNGLSWYYYQNPRFRPNYFTPPSNSQCNGSAQCEYDYNVTGSCEVGRSNIFRNARAEALEQLSIDLANRCPEQVNVTHGYVEVNIINDTNVEYYITCDLEWKLKGNANTTCLNGRYTLPICTTGAARIASSWSSFTILLLMLCVIYLIK